MPLRRQYACEPAVEATTRRDADVAALSRQIASLAVELEELRFAITGGLPKAQHLPIPALGRTLGDELDPYDAPIWDDEPATIQDDEAIWDDEPIWDDDPIRDDESQETIEEIVIEDEVTFKNTNNIFESFFDSHIDAIPKDVIDIVLPMDTGREPRVVSRMPLDLFVLPEPPTHYRMKLLYPCSLSPSFGNILSCNSLPSLIMKCDNFGKKDLTVVNVGERHLTVLLLHMHLENYNDTEGLRQVRLFDSRTNLFYPGGNDVDTGPKK